MYFKELAHAFVGAGKSEACKQSGRLEIQATVDVVLSIGLENSGRIFMLQPGSRIPFFSGHLRLFF